MKKRLIISESQLKKIINKILLESSQNGELKEFYHTTHSSHIDSLAQGIDTRRAKGKTARQGEGFYVFSNKRDAVNHANNISPNVNSSVGKDEPFQTGIDKKYGAQMV
jgi:hypothetical protein